MTKQEAWRTAVEDLVLAGPLTSPEKIRATIQELWDEAYSEGYDQGAYDEGYYGAMNNGD